MYRIPNSCALQCRVKASFHGTGKSALWTPKLCQAAAQSMSVQQHLLPESSKNDCPPAFAENSRQVYTSLLQLFISMYSASKKKYLSWSASSLWDVWMNSASTAVWTTFQILLIKSCLDRGSPLLSYYRLCAEQELLHSSKLPVPCKTKVNGLQCTGRYLGAIAL